jgi:ATP-binding cassette subfamily B protein
VHWWVVPHRGDCLPVKIPSALEVVAPSARPHARRLGVAALVVLLQVGVTLLRPWPLALAVDHALANDADAEHPIAVLGLAAGATVLLSLLLGVLDLLMVRCSEGAAEQIGATLRQRMFDHVVSRSLRWHDRIRSGELVSRLSTDVGRLLDAVVATTTTLVPDAVMVLAALALMTHLDPSLSLVGLSVVPLIAGFAVLQRRRVRASQDKARTQSGRLVTTTNDLLRNIRAIQAFGRSDRARSVYAAGNRAVLDAEVGAVEVEARWTPMGDVVLALGTALVLLVGGSHVLAGSLSVGGLLVVLAYLRDLYSPVRGLTRLSAVLAKASVSAGRISEVLECDEAVTEVPHAWPAPVLIDSVRFDNVSFGYEPHRRELHEFDLEIRAGETVCLLGPSGIGKSTITYLLLRLYDVDEGRILLDGVDIRSCSLASVRSRFSYVPQDPWLLDATIAENIALGSRTATRRQVEEAARLALVDEFVDRLPHGYDTLLGEGAVRLSGGQRRRVSLARAAVRRAPMMLLDEPTASLDRDSADAVTRSIATLSATQTTLIVTHDARLTEIADRVVTLGADVPHETTQPLELLGREVTPA